MSSSAELDQSKEQGKRQGFVQSVWQALSGSRVPTTEERTRKSPIPVFEGQDAGTTNRELASVGSVGFSEEKVTDLARVDEIRPRESPLTFYSDRQLGMELNPDAGRQAGIDFAARNSRAFSSPLHPQPTVGFVSGRDLVFSGPIPPLAIRGLANQNFSQASPYQFSSALGGHERRVSSEDPSPRLGRTDGGNITQRDAKRPKERSRDKAYKQRFSMGSSGGMEGLPNPAFFVSGQTGQDKIAHLCEPAHSNSSGCSGFQLGGRVRTCTNNH